MAKKNYLNVETIGLIVNQLIEKHTKSLFRSDMNVRYQRFSL